MPIALAFPKLNLYFTITPKICNMKTQFYLPIYFLLIVSLFIAGCKKDSAKNAKLPPITQEGKNTIGFTINGEVWVPYYKCRFMGNPCGEISATYGESGGAALDAIGFQFARERGSKSSSLTFSSSGIGTITTVGNKIDSIHITYRDENSMGNVGYYTGPLPGSKFIINNINKGTQVISGEFEFILVDQNGDGNTITLKDGRFDFKFNACKCSD